MREELENITIMLSSWCEKYKKDYVTVCYIDNSAMANTHPNDVDYDQTRIYLNKKQIQSKLPSIRKQKIIKRVLKPWVRIIILLIVGAVIGIAMYNLFTIR